MGADDEPAGAGAAAELTANPMDIGVSLPVTDQTPPEEAPPLEAAVSEGPNLKAKLRFSGAIKKVKAQATASSELRRKCLDVKFTSLEDTGEKIGCCDSRHCDKWCVCVRIAHAPLVAPPLVEPPNWLLN